MKLFEMGTKAPTSAGKARLVFTKDVVVPTLEDEVIRLPADPEAEFFPLKDGDQFLFRCSIPPERRGDSAQQSVWFGGTDEQRPFSVRLHEDAFSAFIRGRERGFYNSLKPEVIRVMETRSRKAKRQGDIFAVLFPLTWEELTTAQGLIERSSLDIQEVDQAPVYNTRHRFTGRIVQSFYLKRSYSVILGCGVLTAPDHEPLKLGSVHVLAQAANLYSDTGD